MRLADGRHVARWTDPATKALRQESLDRLGLSNHAARELWAVAKAEELQAARRAYSLAGGKAEPMTVDEALANYATAKPVADRTASSRKVPLEEFAKYLRERGIRRIDAVTAPKLWPWRDQVVAQRDLLESTRNLRLATVAAFLRWCASRDLVPLLPLDKIRGLAERIAQPKHKIEFLRPAELRAVLETGLAMDAETAALPPRPGSKRRRIAAMLLVLATSGMRWAEAAGLDWSEVDLEAGEIRLPAERTKGRRGRVVTLAETPTLQQLLAAMHRKAGEPKAGLAMPPRWHGQVWRQHERRLRDRLGLEVTPHTLRRTVGTYLACAPGVYGGASAFMAAKRLGHSVQIAERHYAGAVTLPREAATLEAAAGIEGVAAAIVAAETGGS